MVNPYTQARNEYTTCRIIGGFLKRKSEAGTELCSANHEHAVNVLETRELNIRQIRIGTELLEATVFLFSLFVMRRCEDKRQCRRSIS
jgi:hypothetical protein